MMPSQRISLATGLGVWPLDNIHFGAIMLYKIEIDRSEIFQLHTQVPHAAHHLQKNFRQDYRAAGSFSEGGEQREKPGCEAGKFHYG